MSVLIYESTVELHINLKIKPIDRGSLKLVGLLFDPWTTKRKKCKQNLSIIAVSYICMKSTVSNSLLTEISTLTHKETKRKQYDVIN